MRFIKGDSLKEAINRFHGDIPQTCDPAGRSLALRNLLRRFTDVCNTIDYAHSRGVLHRDIKPGNIIIGKYGETLVVDWGLAKPLGRAEPGHESGERTLVPTSASGSAETLPGSALGTPAYMSPEQASGELDRLGSRSDVYSLGATLYCLLTGRAPFEGDDVGEMLRKVQRGEFVRPRQLDPSLNKALEAVCLKAMALYPDDRYASCRALAEDVERWMADEAVSAHREKSTERLARWTRRHRAWAQAVAAALLIVASIATVAALLVDRALRRAGRPRCGHAIVFCRTVGEGRRRREFETGHRQVLSDLGRAADAMASYERELAVYERLTATDPANPGYQDQVASASNNIAVAQIKSGKIALALAALDRARDIRERVAAAHPTVSQYQKNLAQTYKDIGTLKSRTNQASNALAAYLRTGNPSPVGRREPYRHSVPIRISRVPPSDRNALSKDRPSERGPDDLRRGRRDPDPARNPDRDQASNSLTTVPWTSVSRKSRP